MGPLTILTFNVLCDRYSFIFIYFHLFSFIFIYLFIFLFHFRFNDGQWLSLSQRLPYMSKTIEKVFPDVMW